MTADLKGLIEELRAGRWIDVVGSPSFAEHVPPTQLELKAATALESILSRQPFEHELNQWQMVPLMPSAAMLKDGDAECHTGADDATINAWFAMLTASAEEAKK